MDVASQVTYSLGKGGSVLMAGPISNIQQTGVADGWAYIDEFHLNSASELTLDLTGPRADIDSDPVHVTGNHVIDFDISSDSIIAEMDIEIHGLDPGDYYEFTINDTKRRCKSGFTDGKTTDDGVLRFFDIRL